VRTVPGDEQSGDRLPLAWLDAYYKGDDDPLIVDTDKFEENAKKLEEYCVANPSVGVMNASEKLFR
jgi:acid stress chaperone HdeB